MSHFVSTIDGRPQSTGRNPVLIRSVRRPVRGLSSLKTQKHRRSLVLSVFIIVRNLEPRLLRLRPAKQPDKKPAPVPMKKPKSHAIDLEKLNAKLWKWQRQHNTPAKVAAAHRKVIPDRVIQSMSFENEPVSIARLKALLKKKTISGR